MTNSEGGTRTPVPAGPVRSDSFFMRVVPGAVQQQWLDDLLLTPLEGHPSQGIKLILTDGDKGDIGLYVAVGLPYCGPGPQ